MTWTPCLPAGDSGTFDNLVTQAIEVNRPYLVDGAIISHAQPARKQRPPSGVTGPSQRRFVSAIKYKLPLNRKMPAKSNHHAPRFAMP